MTRSDTIPLHTRPEIHARRWFLLAIMCLSLVMVVMSVSGLNVAIPSIQASLGASATDLQWIVDSYAIIFAGLLLTAGAIGDRFGRKLALNPLSPPFYAAYAVPMRYKTNGGLRIDSSCRLIDVSDEPIPNLFAAGSCSGTVSPNVGPVVASGLYAGERLAEELRSEA